VRLIPKSLKYFFEDREVIDTRCENAAQTEKDLVTISRVYNL